MDNLETTKKIIYKCEYLIVIEAFEDWYNNLTIWQKIYYPFKYRKFGSGFNFFIKTIWNKNKI